MINPVRWQQKLAPVMYSPTVSSDGKLMAASDFWPGGTAYLVDTTSGSAAAPLKLPQKPQSPLGIAPDRKSIAYVGEGGNLSLYSLAEGKNVWQTAYHGNVINAPAFSPDGSKIAMPGDSGPQVVNAADGKTAWSHSIGQIITTSPPAWSADGKKVAIIVTADDPNFDRTVDVMDAKTGKPAYKAIMEPQDDDKKPIMVDVYDLQTNQLKRKLEVDMDGDRAFHVTDPQTHQVVFNGAPEAEVQNGHLVGLDYKLTDPKTGDDRFKCYLRKFEGGADGPKPANLYILDATTGQLEAAPTSVGIGYDGNSYWRDYHVAFAPDGRSLAITRNDGGTTSVSLYDAGSLSKTWEGSVQGKTSAPVFSPDGSQVAVTSLDFKQKDPQYPTLYPMEYSIATFDAASGKPLADTVLPGSTDRDSVSAPFYSGHQVCAVDVNQSNGQASLVAF
ncbi:MAG: WD40 repeat domain-containing protein [Candidatus Xenobia bacterium]